MASCARNVTLGHGWQPMALLLAGSAVLMALQLAAHVLASRSSCPTHTPHQA